MGNWIIKNVKYLTQCLMEVFYAGDDNCIICGDLPESFEDTSKEDLLLCPKCMSTIKICMDSMNIEMNGRSFKCYSAAYYSGAMKELILRLKYKSDFISGENIAYYMKKIVEREKLNFDTIVCVPSGHSAYKRRGYNQSYVLAKDLGRLLDKKVSDPIIKIRETSDQIGLSGASRWQNMENSFKVRDEKALKNKKILLIDDVVTTGATGFYCAAELMDAGAEEVTILTAAKSRL